MLQLFLLRHADAPHRGQNGQHMDDDERRLSPRGIKDAHNLGKYMRDHEYPAPETVLCSAALRTRQTAQYLYEGWNISPHTEYRGELYLASAGTMLHNIQSHAESPLMLIGHNPGIYQLALTLARHDNSSDNINALKGMGFPSAGMVVFSFPDLTRWQEISPGSGIIDEFLTPRKIA